MRGVYLAFFIIFASASPCAAQSPNSSSIRYSSTPLTPSTTDVGPQYHGFDPAAIYASAQALSVAQRKSDFETRAQYESRIAGLASYEIAPGTPLSADVPFLLNDATSRDLNAEISFSYNADLETLSINITPRIERFVEAQGLTFAVLKLKSEVRQIGEYPGENSYGAATEVMEVQDSLYGVSFERNSWLNGAKIFIKMKPHEAKRLDQDLGVLLLGRLSSPWTLQQFAHDHPTMDDPSDYYQAARYLYVVPDQVWIYDLASGKVIEKINKASMSEGDSFYDQGLQEEFPLRLEISSSCESSISIHYQVDDEPIQSGQFAPGFGENLVDLPLTLQAKRKIVISTGSGYTLAHLTFTLNGVPVEPMWETDSGKPIHLKHRKSPAGPCYEETPKDRGAQVVFKVR